MAKNAKQPEAGKVVVVEQGAKAPVTLSTEEAKAMPAPKAKPAPKRAPAAKTATAKAARKPAAAKASAPATSDAAAPKATAGAKAPALKGQALGMVETRGLVAAIEAADSMVKTADVALLGTERVGSGLVTVLVCGEVSAVTSAVQSGAAAAARLGEVVSTDVIARPVDDIGAVLPAQQ